MGIPIQLGVPITLRGKYMRKKDFFHTLYLIKVKQAELSSHTKNKPNETSQFTNSKKRKKNRSIK